jgi:DNA polymerase II large subunit
MENIAYCVKCKDKREMKDAQPITMKNGKPALQGQCTICGTKLTRIVSTKKAAQTA